MSRDYGEGRSDAAPYPLSANGICHGVGRRVGGKTRQCAPVATGVML